MVNCFALGKFLFKYSKLICFYRQVSISFSNLFWKFNKRNRYSIIRFGWNFVVSMWHQAKWLRWPKDKCNEIPLHWIKPQQTQSNERKKKQNIIREDVRQFLCIFFFSRDRKKAFCLHFVLHLWLR